MAVTLRPAAISDIDTCGRIIHKAMTNVATQHGFASLIPTVEAGIRVARARITDPSGFGVIVEQAGQVIGSAFMSEGDPIRGVGPITVVPGIQGRGIGRQLMQAVLERGVGSASMRLVQDAFNTASMSLYASLGFEVKEPLVLITGMPLHRAPDGVVARPMTMDDLDACASLCKRVLGFERTVDLQHALEVSSPTVVLRSGRPTAYASMLPLTPQAHAVAESVEDLAALLTGAAEGSLASHSFLLPTRQAECFRWCLRERLRAVSPLTLMAVGEYQDPRGCYVPSLLY
jgi:predicted N-acetyltransferase YhbS